MPEKKEETRDLCILLDKSARWSGSMRVERYPDLQPETHTVTWLPLTSFLESLKPLRVERGCLLVHDEPGNTDEGYLRKRGKLLLLLLGRASEKGLVDSGGKIRTRSDPELFASTVKTTMEVVYALFAACLLIPLTLIILGFLAIAGRARRDRRGPRRIDCTVSPGIVYLRTDLWAISWGGAATHIRSFSKAAQGLGTQIHLLTSQKLEDLDSAFQLEIPPFRRLAVLRDIQILAYNITFTIKAIGYIRKTGKVDAIYHRYGAFSWCGAMLSVLLDIPMVLEFNSSEVWWARKMENEFLLFILRAAEKTVLACSDWIATVSKVLNRELVTHGIDADRVFDNPNGVDPEIFHTAPGNEGPGDLVVVGFTGIFAKHHGIDILIEGFNRSCPQENHLHLLLIGGGRLTDWVRGLVTEKGLAPHVTITGMIPHHQVRDHLQRCDMLVLPHPKMGDGSDFFGSPVKLFEYMMSGRAILSTNVGQMGKILHDRSTALLVGPEDPGEIARGITELSNDTALRIKMGKRARRLALQRYTWEDNVRRVLDRICRGEL